MSNTVNLDLPMQPGKAPPTLRQLAGKVAKDSIVTQALERLIEQIVQVAAEHEGVSTFALRARVAELEAANKTLRDEIAQYWEPLVLGIVNAKAG